MCSPAACGLKGKLSGDCDDGNSQLDGVPDEPFHVRTVNLLPCTAAVEQCSVF